MEYVFDDGGRACAGYRGATGDCVTRAIAIAMELPYQDVYTAMAEGNAAQRITKRSCKRTAGVRTASTREGSGSRTGWPSGVGNGCRQCRWEAVARFTCERMSCRPDD